MEKKLKWILAGVLVLVLLYSVYLTREHLLQYLFILFVSLAIGGLIVFVYWLVDKIARKETKESF